jgi:tRNA threonylcarbamoyladenosine biosynthesis protein TsaB
LLCLGIDTALGACSAALADEQGVRLGLFEHMSTGHAEAIAPMVERLMREAGLGFADLGRIAVTTGPGTFTGQRIGLAFARGLALALKIPCVGVTTLEAIAAAARDAHPGQAVTVALDARKGEAYVQGFGHDGLELAPPALLTHADAAAGYAGNEIVLAGTAAEIIAPLITAPCRIASVSQPDAAWVAQLGHGRDPVTHPPAPLYLRAPDAKLPGPLKPVPFRRPSQ